MIVILLLALPVSAAAEDRVMVNYTFIDENSVTPRDFTGLKESHFGLSNGVVAYHKGQTIYTWDSRTKETRTLEIPPVSNYHTKIQTLDITEGKVYYVFHKNKVRALRGSEGGLYVFDGKNNTLITPFSHHDILSLIADNNRILFLDATNYQKPLDVMKTKVSGAELLVYSPDRGDITKIDNLSDIDDPSGFGGNTIVTATYSIGWGSSYEVIRRHPGDGLALFTLAGSPGNLSVTQISIPSGTNIGSSGGIVGFDPDCFSEDYFVWKKTTGIRTPAYHSVLYLTDLRTLKNVVLAETDGAFSDYLYAVDGDYVIYGRTLYHIPTGTKTELSFNGELDKLFDAGLGELLNNKTLEIDIIRFNDEGLLIRTYPKVEDAGYSGKSQLFFADLGPVIHAGEHVQPVTLSPVIPTTQQGETTPAPVSLLIPGFALVVIGMIVLMRKRRE
ncbi:hypothetical protein [Methanoregula formicica]|uniref:hypothetical protein n=1 Tax=Methanoregula formicica TaxID=882104 RepID=UPI0011D22C3B|nr:hypothetical protein [Methanoregula formicica]